MLGSDFARLFLTHEKRKYEYEVARSCTTKHQISSDLLDAVILQATRRTGSKGVYIYKKMVDNRVFFTHMMVLFTFFKGFNFSTHNNKRKPVLSLSAPWGGGRA